MSTTDGTWTGGRSPLHGLYRDRENGWILGVCAGIAERFGFAAGTVRIIATLALVLFFLPTALLYLAAAVLLRDRPLTWRGQRAEQDFWKSCARDKHWSSP